MQGSMTPTERVQGHPGSLRSRAAARVASRAGRARMAPRVGCAAAAFRLPDPTAWAAPSAGHGLGMVDPSASLGARASGTPPRSTGLQPSPRIGRADSAQRFRKQPLRGRDKMAAPPPVQPHAPVAPLVGFPLASRSGKGRTQSRHARRATGWRPRDRGVRWNRWGRFENGADTAGSQREPTGARFRQGPRDGPRDGSESPRATGLSPSAPIDRRQCAERFGRQSVRGLNRATGLPLPRPVAASQPRAVHPGVDLG